MCAVVLQLCVYVYVCRSVKYSCVSVQKTWFIFPLKCELIVRQLFSIKFTYSHNYLYKQQQHQQQTNKQIYLKKK